MPAHGASSSHERRRLWREYGAYLRYYDREASRSRIWYQVLKLATVSIGALLPVLVAVDAPASCAAGWIELT